MLINKIRNSYRDMVRYLDPVEAIVTLDNSRPAANSAIFDQPEAQARRLRRQLRLVREGRHNASGWSLRTW